jgi:hypothetical protein
VSEQDVKHIEGSRLLDLVQVSDAVHEAEWEHIETCDECREAFIMLKHIVERSRTRSVC